MSKERMIRLNEEQGSAHILLAYNVYLGVMEYFTDPKVKTLSKDGFMDLNNLMWEIIKEELNLDEVLKK